MERIKWLLNQMHLAYSMEQAYRREILRWVDSVWAVIVAARELVALDSAENWTKLRDALKEIGDDD